MNDRIQVATSGPIFGSIQPPGSKSITNRALVCAALAHGNSILRGALDSEDTQVMIDSLDRLGIVVEASDEKQTLAVTGCGGRLPKPTGDLFVGNSGTTIRFLTAMLAACEGEFRLDGVPRMRERPIGDLMDALNRLGSDCQGEIKPGFPPVKLKARGLGGGDVEVRGDVSSQFLSGLLMAAPVAKNPVRVHVTGDLVSKPYVHMTLAVMKSFGIDVGQTRSDDSLSLIELAAPQKYTGIDYQIEPDASAASYFWAAAAITGGSVTVKNLGPDALQGDVGIVDCLEQMGCQVERQPQQITVSGKALRGIEVDMNAISDTVQTLAAVALFADGPTIIHGVGHIRHKETDRIGDLARELRKLGATVEERDEGLTIIPGPLKAATIETYRDHRMAMSLALPGLLVPGVVILDPGCTAKTYPHYFEDLAALCRGAH